MPDKPQVVLWAPAPALVQYCGVSLLERHLRVLQRLGFRQAIVISPDPEVIGVVDAPPSWARREIKTESRRIPERNLSFGRLGEAVRGDGPVLVVPADIYCDARLLDALTGAMQTTALIDSSPPGDLAPLLSNGAIRYSGAALLEPAFVRENPSEADVAEAVRRDARGLVDAATEPDYVSSMRRHLRPVWFPAPTPENRACAERLILDSAKKYPALIHSPAQTAIVRLICRTSITPTGVTWFAFVLGWGVTWAFATGWLWSATLTALFIGILDGVDGRLARVKVETTQFGTWEHWLDYAYEISWWLALGYYFFWTGLLPWGPALAFVLIGTELLDCRFRRGIRQRTGRPPDDVAPIDRAFRCIAARRNIFLWMFVLGLIADRPAEAFVAMCVWQMITILYVVVRWFVICICGFYPGALDGNAEALGRNT